MNVKAILAILFSVCAVACVKWGALPQTAENRRVSSAAAGVSHADKRVANALDALLALPAVRNEMSDNTEAVVEQVMRMVERSADYGCQVASRRIVGEGQQSEIAGLSAYSRLDTTTGTRSLQLELRGRYATLSGLRAFAQSFNQTAKGMLLQSAKISGQNFTFEVALYAKA